MPPSPPKIAEVRIRAKSVRISDKIWANLGKLGGNLGFRFFYYYYLIFLFGGGGGVGYLVGSHASTHM